NFIPYNFIVHSSAYNPADGRIYFLSANDENYELKSFDPEQPEIINDHGIFSEILITFAINSHGEAFGISMNTLQSTTLYSIDLTNASITPIGNTGLFATYTQSMAFDMETGELFWAQISSPDDVGLYYVDHTNANVTYLGQIGSGAEITGLFAVPEGEVSLEEYVPEKLVVYPNPAIDRLYINNAEGVLVSIFDNMGRLVMEKQYNNYLNINSLPNGIYIIKTGARTTKFVKN
ncbi:MAG: T9SS type A sorting domain-containing protein, partial [Bacteroidales bacterium]|nr:T9SS type A sorting domain-containing protein [Bacteroidales bacterium]